MGVREKVQDYYAARLAADQTCCGNAAFNDLAVPSFGCGEPTKFADLKPGETVLDLGSGAGLDAFRAAEVVGPKGRVIGVDMTPEMLQRAHEGAAKLSLENVQFLEGTIEALPVPDASVDVVISNCVINLSDDKAAVFGEAFRVLEPGGRLLVSDILRYGERLTVVSEEGWCACEDGAEPAEVYRRLLKQAGFVDITVAPAEPAVFPGDTYSALISARRPNIRRAHEGDLPAIRQLLEAARLPVEGLADTRLFVLEETDHIVGVVGFESYPPYVLLRSLAVVPEVRGQGKGRWLLDAVLQQAKAAGHTAAYGLTTTIPDWLSRLGLEEISRADLPAELAASAELRGACPASGRVFTKAL